MFSEDSAPFRNIQIINERSENEDFEWEGKIHESRNIVGEITLGGSIEPLYNPVTIAEIAIEKGATTL